MARMKLPKTTRKVSYSSISAAVATLVIYLLNTHALPDPLPVGVAAAITTLITYLVGYYVPPHPSDGLAQDDPTREGPESAAPAQPSAGHN